MTYAMVVKVVMPLTNRVSYMIMQDAWGSHLDPNTARNDPDIAGNLRTARISVEK
jgi:hypothetical protein